MCLQRVNVSAMAVHGGSHQFISLFITKISLDAGLGYKLILKQHRDAAMTSSRSASGGVVVRKGPGWSLVSQKRHIAFGEDRVITAGWL